MTLVMAGGDTFPWIRDGAKALVEVLPDARYLMLEGQSHTSADAVLAPILIDFFKTTSG